MLKNLGYVSTRKNSVSEFLGYVRQGIPSAIFGVNDAFKSYLTGLIESPVLFVAKDGLNASLLTEMIKEYSDKKVVLLPPKDELLLPFRAYSKDILFERIKALNEIATADVIVATAETLMQSAPLKISKIKIEKNQEVVQNEIVSRLVYLGYLRVESVEAKGTFSVRGDVVDIYPINSENAIRIDFFGDTAESIKIYNCETRENLGYIEKAEILQTREFIFSDREFGEYKCLMEKEIKEADREKKVNLKTLYEDICVAMENNDLDMLSVLSPLSSECGRVFDLLKKDTVVVLDEAKRINELALLSQTEFTERYNSLKKDGEVFSFAIRNFSNVEILADNFNKFRCVAMQAMSTAIPFFNPLKVLNPKVGGIANYRLDFKEVFTDINNWLYNGYNVQVFTGEGRKAKAFNLDLSDKGIASSIDSGEIKGVQISSEKLTCGFIFHEEKLVVIGSGNLYSKPVSKRQVKSKQKGFFTAPEVGDYCVHETHGIGRVLGNKKISTQEGTKDYVSVEYADGDILYVPVEQMDVLTKYLGGEKKPRLSKIGGFDFERIKNKVKESIKKMSFDLKRLYSERDAMEGYKFYVDEELENAFIEAFPFEDTLDQATCNKEIKKDMTSGKVMDRLVCGDVGFGKTEVAFRAVFRAVVNGKQAAMIAPTTILTEQHYNTAVNRFSGFGVKIAVLNRFKTDAEQDRIIEKIKNGEIDFIIGTHRLLSKDVSFKDLGLLVLDEEQRFGVEHKEKIKLLKKNVDALTLTATPIPRTLHMSLTGIRSISVINTPPSKRLPVQTYVSEESDTLIKDAISREVNRGGQVFILYNRVESIFSFGERVKALLPSVKMTVVHGRMDERALEKSIMQFYNGETQVLISTTIIENGIDLPRANTIIVIDADKLGLSTLYQLKGRVGRSDRLAYAYYTFKREKILTTTAYERLNAIIEFAEMGSGIKIAMRDLEIRGAGNILGAEQHGHMDKIGYELYSKLLREELTGVEEKIPELDIRVSAYIPENYIESQTSRMDAYKEIAEIKSEDDEKEFVFGIENTYGKLPIEALNLIDIAVVKYLAMKINAKEIVVAKEIKSIEFEDYNAFKNEKLMKTIDEYSENVKIEMSRVPKLIFNAENKDNRQMLSFLKEFLTAVSKK